MITVETTGEFMLIDPISGDEMEPGKQNKVTDTPFVRGRIDLGHLREIKPKPTSAPKQPPKKA